MQYIDFKYFKNIFNEALVASDKKKPINLSKIRAILSQIEEALRELYDIKTLALDEFVKDKKNYIFAEYYLRRALEGILTVGSHFLSRVE